MRENSLRCECHGVGRPVDTICGIVSGIRGLGDDTCTQHGLDDLGLCSITLASHLIRGSQTADSPRFKEVVCSSRTMNRKNEPRY